MNAIQQPDASVIRQNFPAQAQLYKACGDTMRLEVLRILERDTFGVMELCSIFAIKQSAMSHHLKVLSKAGLVTTQREGNSIFYRRPLLMADDALDAVRQQIFQALDAEAVAPSTLQGIAQVRQQRAQQSQAFFARFADAFQEQQELITEYGLYAEPVREMLARTLPSNADSCLEIGPGEGAFLAELSPLFNSVIALDNSQEMLARAKEFSAAEQLENVHLMFGTSRQAVEEGIQVDAIVLNMVLHHVPSPSELLEDCARLLKPGGILVLSDLSRHDQAWAKESCGDLWLGFESSDISRWASKAGLQEGESAYIGVRNGFQIQVRQFANPEQETISSTRESNRDTGKG